VFSKWSFFLVVSALRHRAARKPCALLIPTQESRQ
jgi:hypothetical protein